MRSFLLFFLILLSLAASVFGQTVETATTERPVTRREVRRWLTITQHDTELSSQANRDLIAEIERRGVEFVLSEVEEWSFKLLEASDELLQAIRDGIPAEQRRAILDVTVKKDLYDTFTTNLTRPDLFSRKAALDAGREFVNRFGNDPTVRQQVNLINRQLPQLERTLRMLEQAPRIRNN